MVLQEQVSSKAVKLSRLIRCFLKCLVINVESTEQRTVLVLDLSNIIFVRTSI